MCIRDRYTIVRVLLVSALLAIALVAIPKKAAHLWLWRILALIVAVVLLRVLNAWPVEKSIVSFSSPEAAYTYANQGDVQLVVSGVETDLVIGVKDDISLITILPKTEKGWHIGNGDTVVRDDLAMSGDGQTAFVLQHQKTGEYYVGVNAAADAEITDSCGSVFDQMADASSDGQKAYFYAYVPDLDEQYTCLLYTSLPLLLYLGERRRYGAVRHSIRRPGHTGRPCAHPTG